MTDHSTEPAIITPEEICTEHLLSLAFNALKKDKAPGPDNISNNLIILAWPLIMSTVQNIFIDSLKHSFIPLAWKGKWAIRFGLYTATIRPLYGLYMAFIRPLYGLYMAPIRPLYGLYTAFIRPLYGLYTATIRPLYGHYTASIRPLYGHYTAT